MIFFMVNDELDDDDDENGISARERC